MKTTYYQLKVIVAFGCYTFFTFVARQCAKVALNSIEKLDEMEAQ